MVRTCPRRGLGRRFIAASLLLAVCPWAGAYDLNPDSTESIISIAKQMAADLVSYYDGDKPGQTPGLLPKPYYWWEAGAMMGSLVDYWYYTKDESYNALVTQALLWQVGDTNDYMPQNQTLTEGNDDQGFWALAVMSAAENNFPNPPADKPQWLALAQAVFNTQAARWDMQHCNGGLRWQIFEWNNGYDYKNSISQACFFALGARLALYTGNSSYADWAEKTWEWMVNVNFIDKNWYVYDGAHIGTNCTDIVPYQFTYNAGGFILGAAAMYNFTRDDRWKDRLDNLLEGSRVFFMGPDKNIMTEVACETVDRCNLDQQSFKAYLSRWLASITKWAPHTYDFVMPYLRASAVAAAKQCVGGSNGRLCGLNWYTGDFDNNTGVGQQMAAMEVTLACMVQDRAAPVTETTGGTSKGDPGAGGSDMGRTQPKSETLRPITAADTAGAAILTAVVILATVAAIAWILLDETSDQSPWQQFRSFHSAAGASVAAFAAGGGAAAAHRRKRDRDLEEKAGATGSSGSDRSVQSSESSRAMGEMPVTMGQMQMRGESGPQQHRRVSSMPIGWPHNSSLRPSTVRSGQRPMSMGPLSTAPPDTTRLSNGSLAEMPPAPPARAMTRE
ncbi:cell wall glycosyl hydrolase Dfg5 [Drechmeria coniospora]|uniref:mannan endo-1,6-alpha-mannosidase n=1 Tax=Drechmeria coniospora TaxID=98403 RepID=A0A151GLG3_DRECN|nr:cell wall glycosyl hydrolase Dfg5 [Drechmeria coniospora]KYK57940.1 cell wall glycosyl hydrolase Dfg5 [Drechmeria coniospora]